MTPQPAATGEFAFASYALDWFAIDLPGTPADADRLARQVAVAPPPAGSGQRDALAEMLVRLGGGYHRAVRAVGAYGGLARLPRGWRCQRRSWSACNRWAGDGLDQIGSEMAGADHPGKASAMKTFDLQAGPTVRVERLIEPSASDDDRRPVSFTVEYVAEVPGRDQVVVLTFGSPALALIDRWGPGSTRSPAPCSSIPPAASNRQSSRDSLMRPGSPGRFRSRHQDRSRCSSRPGPAAGASAALPSGQDGDRARCPAAAG